MIMSYNKILINIRTITSSFQKNPTAASLSALCNKPEKQSDIWKIISSYFEILTAINQLVIRLIFFTVYDIFTFK